MSTTVVGVPENLQRPVQKWSSNALILVWSTLIFICGFIVRFAFLANANHDPLVKDPEPVQVALSLLRTGRFADAYGPGVGLTAHMMPLHPMLLSWIFKLVGTGKAAETAMGAVASVASSIAFALLPLMAVVSGLGLAIGVVAGFLGALLPFNFWSQTSGMFDAPYTSVALLLLVLTLTVIWKKGQFSNSEALWFGIAAGLSFLLNPVLAAVVAGWAAASFFRFKQDLRRVALFFLVSAATVMLTLAPWAIRNHYALGSTIWTRSNFGLELEVSNNDILGPDLETNVEGPYFELFHPLTGNAQRARVKRLGEVEYMRQKKEEAVQWISTHRERFLILSAERFRLFWFPRLMRWWQSAGEDILTILALIGALLLYRRGNPLAWIAGAALIAYPAVYYIIQVSVRYRFPLEPIFFLLAATLLSPIADRYFPALKRRMNFTI